MKNDKISVIVPVYNTKKYLEKCIKSITNQTYEKLEILIIDDGSTDDSGDLCEKIKKEDSRIQVYHKTNGGLSSARNFGLDRITGDYVAFVDSDDWIEPDMYEALLNNLVKYEADISCGGIRCITDGMEDRLFNECDENIVYNKNEALIELTNNKKITSSCCDKLFKASLFDGLRLTEGVLYEDMLFTPECLLKTEKIVYTSKPFYNYYMSPDSITRSRISLKHYDAVKNTRNLIDFYKKQCPDGIKYAYAAYYRMSLEILDQTVGLSEWDTLRNEELKLIKSLITEENTVLLTKKEKLRLKAMANIPKVYNAFFALKRKVIK